MRPLQRLKVLFVCTGNSVRSQMAEGWTRYLKGDAVEAYSAGTDPRGLDPRAVKVMAEVGVDISGQPSEHVDEVKHLEFDYVVTVCGHANENCPLFLGKTKVVHIAFDEPSKLAENEKSEEEVLVHFRRVRDDIKAFVERLPGALAEYSQES